MSDIAKAFGAPVVVTLDDKSTLSFPLLTMRQMAELCAMVDTERQSLSNRLASDCKLTGEARAKFRAMVEADDIDLDRLGRWSATPAGTLAILERSLAGNPESESMIAKLAPLMASCVAWLVLGFRMQEGKQPENPTKTGVQSSGEETGGSSNTSTDATQEA